MSSSRLQQHFIRLWQCCQGQSQDTTLDKLASQLNCSRRHMRTLLNVMQRAGWLTWQAEAGRGKRSRLTFVCTGLDLQRQQAEKLLEQDSIDQLVSLVGDKNTLRQMISSHLGQRFREGKHILRVLYYRPLLNLQPGTALRRSESHIVRQIFSGLTTVNEENGEIRADIAHHWQALSATHWRFYIRPSIRFHHGRELTVDDIIHTLQGLRDHALFRHITQVISPTPWTIDIHLQAEDTWLPWLLSSVHAMILPQEWASFPDFAAHPIGTGPYAVTCNNPRQLKIRAFDDYFGYRALIDEVNFWVVPEMRDEVSSSLLLEGMPDSAKAVESRLEEGCYYLLFDSRTPLGADPTVRRWLSHILSPIQLLARVPPHHQQYWFPAYGLLPRWHHAGFQEAPQKPSGLRQLTMTWHHTHAEHDIISQVITRLLADQGVELITQQVSYNDWHQGNQHSDLWLNSVNYTLPLDYALFASFSEVPLLRKCLPLDWEIMSQAWRQRNLPMAEWCKQLTEHHAILPLIHHWLRIEGQRSMRGVKLNTLGWFDFKSAWFAPPEG